MSKRLFEFAKELGLTSKEVLERTKKLGFNIPSQLTVVDEKVQADVRRDLGLVADLSASVPSSPPVPAAPAASKGPTPLKLPPPGTRLGAPAPSSRTITRPAPQHPSRSSAPKPATAPRKPSGPPRPMPVKTGGHGLAAGRPQLKPTAAPKAEVEEKAPAVDPVTGEPLAQPKVLTKIKVTEGITVAELAQKLNVKPGVLIKELMDLKILATINQKMDMTVVETLAGAHDAEVEVVPLYGSEMFQDSPDDPKDLVPRPPVV
ncbi:MAG TPA: translation initiation factor IF-2 N-terminal domain-containing protein, partial [bacterium]|nr:translation initiation factor IF-2 N-terminal domain-containing protein [bacterium]